MYGNPTFWSLPVAAAALGARAAVLLVAYDMLTQPRIALVVRLLRMRAPIAQRSRTALADYAPTLGAVSGLLPGASSARRTRSRRSCRPRHRTGVRRRTPARRRLAATLGVPRQRGAGQRAAWRCTSRSRRRCSGSRRSRGSRSRAPCGSSRSARCRCRRSPSAQMYGYSPRTAAGALVLSVAAAVALAPLALALAG
jgi:hypothetical protein